METFAKLFGSLVVFVYHCFDRMVILGHMPLLTRPEHIVHFFRDVHGTYPITKRRCANGPTNTTAGSTRSRATKTSRSNGPKRRASGKRTTSGRRCTGWSASNGSGCISS